MKQNDYINQLDYSEESGINIQKLQELKRKYDTSLKKIQLKSINELNMININGEQNRTNNSKIDKDELIKIKNTINDMIKIIEIEIDTFSLELIKPDFKNKIKELQNIIDSNKNNSILSSVKGLFFSNNKSKNIHGQKKLDDLNVLESLYDNIYKNKVYYLTLIDQTITSLNNDVIISEEITLKNRLNAVLNELNIDLSEINNEIKKTENKILFYTEEDDVVRLENSKLRLHKLNEVLSLNKEIEKLSSSNEIEIVLDEKTIKMNRLDAILSNLKIKLSDIDEEIKKTQKKIGVYTDDNDIEKLESSNLRLQQLNEVLSLNIAIEKLTSSNEFEIVPDEKTLKMNRLDAILSDLKIKLSDIDEEIKKTQKKIGVYTDDNDIEKLESSNLRLQKLNEVLSLNIEIEKLISSNEFQIVPDEKTLKMNRLDEILSDLKIKLSDIDEEIKKTQKKIGVYTDDNDIEKLESSNLRLQQLNEVLSLNKEIEKLTSSNEIEIVPDEKTLKMNRLDAILSELNIKLSDVDEEIKKTQKKIGVYTDDNDIEKLESSNLRLQKLNEVLSLNNEVEKLTSSNEIEIVPDEKTLKMNRLDAILSELKIKLSDVDEEIKKTQKKIGVYTDDNDIEKLESSNLRLQKLNEVLSLNNEIEKLTSSNEIEIVPDEKTLKMNRLDAILSELKIKLSDVDEEIKKTQKKIGVYTDDNDIEKLESSNLRLQKLNEVLSLNNEVEKLTSSNEIEIVPDEKTLKMNRLDAILSELKIKLSDVDEEIKKTQKKIGVYTDDNDIEKLESSNLRLQKLNEVLSLNNEIEKLTNCNEIAHDVKTLKKNKLDTTLIELKINLSEIDQEIQKTEKKIEIYTEDNDIEKLESSKLRLQKLNEVLLLKQEISNKSNPENITMEVLQQNLIQNNNSNQKIEQDNTIINDISTSKHFQDDNKDISVDEKLKLFYDEYKQMPNCFKRSLFSLICKIGNLNNNFEFIDGFEKSEIEKEFDYLKERLKIESLESSETIYKYISNGQNYCKNSEYLNSMQELQNIVKLIRTIDIFYLDSLVKKVDEAAYSVKDKDIILLLGGTGCGKSTTIHFFSGSKMEYTKINNLNHIAAVENKFDPNLLNKLKTSPFAQSETRYILPVFIDPLKMNIDDILDDKIILCDTPGFEDTSGYEVDIANGIGILKAIHCCNKVRPVLLINYQMQNNRWKDLKNLAHILVNMIKDLVTNLSSFTYIFTKFPDKERSLQSIKSSFEDVKSKLTPDEKKDTAFFSFFCDLVRKTNTGQNAFTLDPLNDSRTDLMNKIISSAPINYPSLVFNFSISEKTKTKIIDQVRRNFNSIISTISRYEYKIIDYELQQIKYLKDLVNLDEINDIYKECINYLIKHFKEEYDNSIDLLKRFDQYFVCDEDLNTYKNYIERFEEINIIRNKYIGNEVVTQDNIIKNLIDYIKNILEKFDDIELNEHAIKNLMEKTEKISIFFNMYNEISKMYQNAKEKVKLKLDKLIKDEFEINSINYDFEKCLKVALKLKNAKENLSDYLEEDYLLKRINECNDFFLLQLDKIIDCTNSIFKTKIDDTCVDNLNICLHHFENAKKFMSFQDVISCNQIEEKYNSIINKISSYFQDKANSIEKIFQNDDIETDVIENLESLFKTLTILRKVKNVDYITAESYFKTFEEISGFISNLSIKIDYIINLLFENNSKNINANNIVDLKKYLTKFSKLQWFDEFKKGVFSSKDKELKEKIIIELKNLSKKIICEDLSLDNRNFNEVCDSIKEVCNIKQLEKEFPEIKESIDELTNWFTKEINCTYEIIANTIDENKWNENKNIDLDFKKLEKIFNYLNISKKIDFSFFRNNARILFDNFENFMKNYKTFINETLTKSKEYIIKINNPLDKEIRTHIRNLNDCFDKISQIYERKYKISSYLDYNTENDIISNWIKIFNKYAIEIENEINDLVKVSYKQQDLDIKLLILKNLSTLEKEFGGEKFKKIYDHTKSICVNETEEIRVELLKSIENHDYKQIAYDMKEFIDVKDHIKKRKFEDAKNKLFISLEKIRDVTKIKIKRIDFSNGIEGIDVITENWKKLKDAQIHVNELVKELDLKNFINENSNTLTKKMDEFIKNIYKDIIEKNFCTADKNISLIDKILNEIEECIGPTNVELIVSKKDEVIKTKNKLIEDIIQQYNSFKIDQYKNYPPKDILIKLENYKDIKNNLIAVIEGKFFNEISTLENNSLNEKNYKQELQKMSYIASTCLPADSLKENVIQRIKSSEEFFYTLSKNKQDDLNKMVEEKNFVDLQISLEENIKNYGESNSRVIFIKKFIKDENESIKKEIIINLEKCPDINNEYIIENLKNIIRLKNHFKFLKTEGKLDLKDKFERLFNLCKISIKNNLDSTKEELEIHAFNVNIKYLPSDNNKPIKTSINPKDAFKFIMDLFFMYKEYKKDMEDINLDFSSQYKLIFNNIHENLNNYQNNFNDSIESLNISKLKLSLKMMSKLNYMREEIKDRKDLFEKDEIFSFVIKILDFNSFIEMINIVSKKLKELKDSFSNENFNLLNEDLMYKNQQDNFFIKLNNKLGILKDLNMLQEYKSQISEINIEKVEKECVDQVEKKLSEIANNAEKILDEKEIKEDSYDKFNQIYNSIASFIENVKEYGNNKDTIVKQNKIKKKLNDKVDEFEKLIKNNDKAEVKEVAKNLINLKIISDKVSCVKNDVFKKLDDSLNNLKTNSKKLFNQLSGALENSVVGKIIVKEHKCFEGVNIFEFNQRTGLKTIDMVLEELTGDDIDKESLRVKYKKFDEVYKRLINKDQLRLYCIDKKKEEELLICNIKTDKNIKDDCPILLANIFALWTLKNTDHYFDASSNNSTKEEDQLKFLLTPHAAQVISILRILGHGYIKETGFINNLIQIGTGEGKSITLSITSIYLALKGFHVLCACYSSYLSKRDYDSFKYLFDMLDVSKLITYGTFNKLCENVINENGDVRNIVENILLDKSNSKSITRSCEKILLIDEVDVFFSKDFYGNTYTPSCSLKDKTISDLIKYIWDERNNINFEKVKNSTAFKECCNKFNKWAKLIEEAVKDMIFDVHNFESHDYFLDEKNGKIGYKDQDTIIYNVVYGYKTLFAYFKECEKGKILKTTLEENMSIGINCGTFSYADIPSLFKYIMGVSGTLKDLSNSELKVVNEDYNIKKFTYAPTVFGKKDLTFSKAKDIFVLDDYNEYINKIHDEITERLYSTKPGTEGIKRAVLVFFESKKALLEFYNSEKYSLKKKDSKILTEETTEEEKENIIKYSTMVGKITLMTKSFGRGTDFYSRDDIVLNNGGIHVIQTFLSLEKSEETQIQGRTARQGQKGSYSLVLLDSRLEWFLINKSELLKNENNYYNLLDSKRNYKFEDQYITNKDNINNAKLLHSESMKFLEAIKDNKFDKVELYLVKFNKGAEEIKKINSKTICLMDGTGSMGALLDKAKSTVGKMFELARETLSEQKMDPNCFQLQFAVYRDYDSYIEGLLEVSPWETKPENLSRFMDKIRAQGGGDYEESIEIGLWHANMENLKEKISQVILIGDAPAKKTDQIKEYRNKYKGETYWKNSKFGEQTHYLIELEKLKNSKIKVHSFYVDDGCKVNFKEIADKTGGKCEKLDVNSSNGAKLLTGMVTEEILFNIGESNGNSEVLVNAFRSKFSYK